MIDRRTLCGAAMGIAAMSALSACGGQEGGSQGGAETVPASWLKCRVGKLSEIDPLLVQDRAGLQVLSAVFTPLMRFDANGDLVPGAALSCAVSDDACTFTFKLPEHAVFHNGERVTASSFKIAWERLVRAIPSGESASDAEPVFGRWGSLLHLVDGYAALRAGRASEMVGLRCPDDATFVVTLTQPCPYFDHVTAHPALGPVPAAALADPEAFALKPVGNGPFALKYPWERGRGVMLASFADCVIGAPLAAGVLLDPMADTVAAYKQFRAGNIDITDVPVDQLSDAEDIATPAPDGRSMAVDARLAHGVEGGLLYLSLNCVSGVFSRPEMRRAACLSVDREALCRKVLKFSGEPALGPISPRVAEIQPWDACTYDPEGSLQLVEAAKLAALQNDPVEGEGSAEEGTETDAPLPDYSLDLDIDLIYRKGGTGARVVAHVVRELEAAGFSVKTEALDTDDFVKRYHAAEFDCALRTLEPPVPALEAIVDELLAYDRSSAGISVYRDEQLDHVLAEARRATDVATRRALIQDALSMAGESLPLIPLAHPAYTKIASDRVAASAVDASGKIDLFASELV